MKLTKESRAAMSSGEFAVPGKREIPIHDAAHVRMAWSAVSAAAGLTYDERKIARQRVISKAKHFGVDATQWERGRLNAPIILHAMALNIATDDHPNKMPFTGIMTRIDEPSDAAPEGSNGRLITISAEAARNGLKSLLGMAVDYKPGLDGHDARNKIGVITEATIDGNAIHIGGFIYAADFPEVAAEIKARKDVLGFSYEARNLFTNDPDANPCVITDCTFTGAAILLKAKAAYRTTSIKATAGKIKMDPELKALLDAITAGQTSIVTNMTALSASVAKLESDKVAAAAVVAKVEPLAASLEAQATTMEAAGVNAKHLRDMATYMRVEASQGRMPVAFVAPAAVPAVAAAAGGLDAAALETAMKPFKEQIAALGTQITDLKAAAAKEVKAPERKTLSPAITALLARAGITVPDGKDGNTKLDAAKLDIALKDMPTSQRLQTKVALSTAGLID